jgi:hypothetical protein
MMQYTAYRLGEYKIIEDEHGDLWWETHIGLGSSKSVMVGDPYWLRFFEKWKVLHKWRYSIHKTER